MRPTQYLVGCIGVGRSEMRQPGTHRRCALCYSGDFFPDGVRVRIEEMAQP